MEESSLVETMIGFMLHTRVILRLALNDECSRGSLECQNLSPFFVHTPLRLKFMHSAMHLILSLDLFFHQRFDTFNDAFFFFVQADL